MQDEERLREEEEAEARRQEEAEQQRALERARREAEERRLAEQANKERKAREAASKPVRGVRGMRGSISRGRGRGETPPERRTCEKISPINHIHSPDILQLRFPDFRRVQRVQFPESRVLHRQEVPVDHHRHLPRQYHPGEANHDLVRPRIRLGSPSSGKLLDPDLIEPRRESFIPMTSWSSHNLCVGLVPLHSRDCISS